MQMNDAHRPRTAFLCLARDLGGDPLLSVRRSFRKLKIPNIFDGTRRCAAAIAKDNGGRDFIRKLQRIVQAQRRLKLQKP